MIEKILQFLLKLLGFYEEYKQDKKEEKKQADYDAIEKNTGDWFNEHFNGVHKPSDVPNDADKTSETDNKR
jgi:uridine kinase